MVRIEEFLRAQGYRDAKAPHTRSEKNGELVITFTVQRGAQYRVASVMIEGNRATSLDELSAVLRAREGNPFSQSEVDADRTTIERLYRARGFSAVRVQADAKPNTLNGWKRGVYHVSHEKGAFWDEGLRAYFAYRDLGMVGATGGKVRAHVIRPNGPCTGQGDLP